MSYIEKINKIEKDYLKKDSSKLIEIIAKMCEGKRILDVGCNIGFTTSKIKENNLDSYILGVDNDCVVIEEARKRYPDLVFKCDDIYNLNMEERVDCILVGEVVEHVDRLEALLIKLDSLLNENGYVIISTPNAMSLNRVIYMLFRVNSGIGGDDHKRLFTWQEAMTLFGRKFDIEEYRGFYFPIVPFRLINYIPYFIHRFYAWIFPTFSKMLIFKLRKREQ